MFGQIQLEQFIDNKLPPKAQTIWDGVKWTELADAGYKPLIYLGPQPVNGILQWFIAEQTLLTHPIARHVVKLAVLQQGDEYTFIGGSVSVII